MPGRLSSPQRQSPKHAGGCQQQRFKQKSQQGCFEVLSHTNPNTTAREWRASAEGQQRAMVASLGPRTRLKPAPLGQSSDGHNGHSRSEHAKMCWEGTLWMEVCPDDPVHPSSGQEGNYNIHWPICDHIMYDLTHIFIYTIYTLLCPLLWLDITLVVWVSEPSAVRSSEVPCTQRMYWWTLDWLVEQYIYILIGLHTVKCDSI